MGKSQYFTAAASAAFAAIVLTGGDAMTYVENLIASFPF